MSQELWYVRDRNKVTGPFSPEQLHALRGRGQLARFHEVSRDRQTWSRASSLAFLFASNAPSTFEPIVPVAEENPEPAPFAWYYSSGQTPMGPIETAALLDLLRRGTINAETLVWREGLPAWVPLRTLQLDQTPAVATAPGAIVPPATAPAATPTVQARRRKRLITGMVTGVVLLVAGLGAVWSLSGRHHPGISRLIGAPTIQSMSDAPDLAAAVGLVLCGWIQTDFDGTRTEVCLSTGTCFVASEKGYLITNRHVIDNTSKLLNAKAMRAELEEKMKAQIEPRIWVFFKHKKYEATIRHESDQFDLAVLKIKPDRPLPHFRLAVNETVPRGTPVFALGFPEASRTPLSGEEALQRLIQEHKKGVRVESHFQKSNFEYVITDGIISLVRRDGDTIKIEHTAKISPGNSGGPLAKEDGTVVGINTLIVQGDKEASPIFVAQGLGIMHEELTSQVPELSEP